MPNNDEALDVEGPPCLPTTCRYKNNIPHSIVSRPACLLLVEKGPNITRNLLTLFETSQVLPVLPPMAVGNFPLTHFLIGVSDVGGVFCCLRCLDCLGFFLYGDGYLDYKSFPLYILPV